MAIKNKVQLITYPDSLGGDLNTLNSLLNNQLDNLFTGGVHILPPFPSSGDRGFAPLTYLDVDPKFGKWNDIKVIGEKYDILIDLMVNHISKESDYFQDFLKNGTKSNYKDMFITLDKIWKNGKSDKNDLEKIFLRRDTPYSSFEVGEEQKQINVWTTFGKEVPSEQIDLDIHSDLTKCLFSSFFKKFSENNVSMVRLDAVGYVIKKMGTSCFFVEPEIYDFLDWIQNLANSYNIELLPEVHANLDIQNKLSERGYWIYDFILPYTVLEALLLETSETLILYLKNRSEKQFTTLDCHDGVPILPDVEGLVNTKQAQRVVDICVGHGANISKIITDEYKSTDGFDAHQINGTFYSLLGKNDDAYIAARAIQLFVPGIPQIYYVGLFADENDNEAIDIVGDKRAINRHNYKTDEIKSKLEKPIVQKLIKLIEFRNNYSAFNGEFSVINDNFYSFQLHWEDEVNQTTLKVNLKNKKIKVTFRNKNGEIVPLNFIDNQETYN